LAFLSAATIRSDPTDETEIAWFFGLACCPPDTLLNTGFVLSVSW